MSYLKSKAGSIEEIVRGMTKHANEGAYQDMFKKELEKAGKGIGAMTPAEKKAFFNKIDAKYTAKNEELTAAQKKLPPALQKAIKDKEDKKENVEEKVDNPYAVGMAAAMKKTGDKPPLKKSTITKAHDIAKSIEKDEKNEEVNEDKGYTEQQIKMAYGVLNDPRYRQGNYSGAVATIEKIAKGLSKHPDVANALKRANEDVELDKLKEDVAKLFETHTFRTQPMNDRQKKTGGEKEVINPIKKEEKKETVKMSEETAKNFDLYRAVHSVWTNAAEDLEEMKKNAKYMKPADDVSTKEPEEQKEKKEEKKEDNSKAELEKAKNEIAMLKTKLENEKNKAVKPEPNPETGEVPLTIGVAYKHMKDKMEQEKMKKEDKEDKTESEKEKGKTMIGSQKTKVETEPSVDYTK